MDVPERRRTSTGRRHELIKRAERTGCKSATSKLQRNEGSLWDRMFVHKQNVPPFNLGDIGTIAEDRDDRTTCQDKSGLVSRITFCFLPRNDITASYGLTHVLRSRTVKDVTASRM